MKIDYYYSHVSPWTFLGHQRLRDIAAKHDAEIDFVPLTLAKIFPVSGGLPLGKRAPQRQEYRMWELKRWPAYLGIEINIEPAHFPVDDGPSAKIAGLAKQHGGDIADLSGAFLRAVWQEERDITDPDTLIAIANENGFDGKALYEESITEAGERVLEENSQRGIDAGVYGSPFYIVGGEPFWGQDRLDLLERLLTTQ
ncbi:MAG: 2-hydroxychromene-2-carboxylate isomerase [Rhodospirillaceae bacterium]|nr:2-hydroxychromene-2-carboxylate isomerase [Rhodospirillaceae bacterium]MBL6942436.1 2-hydroxychromene-2-carboxylate isomerase [Rhodospirillales bacterium]